MVLPESTTAQVIPPPFTPEQEDTNPADAQQDSQPGTAQDANKQRDGQKEGLAAEEMDIDVMNDVPTALPIASKPSNSGPPGSQADISGSADNRQAAAGTSGQPPGAAETSQQQQNAAAKPTVIVCGARLLKRSIIRKSHDFTDSGSIKTALADAWSQDSNVGKQLAALYELFGDGILPYVPMLPCLSSSI